MMKYGNIIMIICGMYGYLFNCNNLFHKNRGDFYYGCWMLPYNEVFFKKLKISYKKCLAAENIQKRLIQLKTNYKTSEEINSQVKILDKVLNKIKSNYLKI